MSSPTLGDASVSTTQNLTLQVDALAADGRARSFVAKASGARVGCRQLARLPEQRRIGAA